MATYNYNDLVNYIDSKTRNQTSSVSPSLRSVINNSITDEITDFDYRSLQRHTNTLRAVYNDVLKYPLPSDMQDEALFSIHKFKAFDQGSEVNYRKVNLRKFNSNKADNTFAFDYDKGVKWLAGNLVADKGIKLIHNMDSLTDNGTWTAVDDGSAIKLVSNNNISGTYAIQITNTGTSNSIVNSDFTAVDISLTDFLFTWVYVPSTTNLSNVIMLVGSSASAYTSITSTSPFNLDSFQPGWNLVGFDRSTGTDTGSPDEDAIDYIKLTVTYSSASTEDIVFDQVWAAEGDPYDLVYGSTFAWRTSSGTWQGTSTVNSDILNADEEEFKVWKKRCAYDVATAIPMADTDIARLRSEFLEAKKNYQRKYTSQRKRIKSFY